MARGAARRRHRRRRPVHDPLHVGDDRPAEGRDADAPQHGAHGLGDGVRARRHHAGQRDRAAAARRTAAGVDLRDALLPHLRHRAVVHDRRRASVRRSSSRRRAGGTRPRTSGSPPTTACRRGRACPRSSGACSSTPTSSRSTSRRLTMVSSGGAPFPPELMRVLNEKIPTANLSNGYGMSESMGAGTLLSGERYFTHRESVGAPYPTLEVQIRDERPQRAPGRRGRRDLPARRGRVHRATGTTPRRPPRCSTTSAGTTAATTAASRTACSGSRAACAT